MRTRETKIKYFKWDGDPIAAKSEFKDEPNIKVNFQDQDLKLIDVTQSQQSMDVKRGLNVVAILNPRNNGYDYFRMNDAQLDDYVDKANGVGDSPILIP